MMRKFKLYILYAFGIIFIFYLWTEFYYREKNPIVDTMEINTVVKKIYNDMKYILVWTNPKADPIMYFGDGQETFIKRQCPVTNCYVTSDRLFFEELNDFDVILFHGPEINKRLPKMPKERSIFQKYIFASKESSDYYSVCDIRFDRYFNWTLTYKLNSDVYYGYITIRNKTGNIIGPKNIMHWRKLEDMTPITEIVKEKLINKSRVAAWFVSNCQAPSGRQKFVDKVQRELKKHDMSVDVYGNCGTKQCPRNSMENCLEMIERDYYFYFSFENSFSEDYVTEKLLHALKNFAIPVVFGAANYTRFMPNGIYLNAIELGAKELVKQMIQIMNDKQKYYDFFKWHNHYTYHTVEESPESDPHCRLCSKINDKDSFIEKSVYDDFKKWWNPVEKC